MNLSNFVFNLKISFQKAKQIFSLNKNQSIKKESLISTKKKGKNVENFVDFSKDYVSSFGLNKQFTLHELWSCLKSTDFG